MKTVYDVLEVSREATPIEIEHRYHRALTVHRAKAAGRIPTKKDQERLCALRKAYLVLSSPSQRIAYDRALDAREQRRRERMNRWRTALAALSMVSGMLLIAAGSHAVMSEEKTETARASHSAPPLLADAQAVAHEDNGVIYDIAKH